MSTTRSIHWIPVALCLAVIGCADRTPRPNVLLVVIDTLRADHLTLYGYGRATSPNLEALARESVLFRNAFSTAPWTTPAIAAILTGQHPAALGIAALPVELPMGAPRISSILKQRGYSTHGVVSHMFASSKFKFDLGFDTWDETHSGDQSYVSSPGVTDQAIQALRQHRGQPIFIFVHYFDPHFDYLEHPGYESLETEGQGGGRGFKSILALREAAKQDALSPSDLQRIKDHYDSEIRFTDAHIGRLFDALKELGQYDQTMIIVTADHGEAFMDRPDRWIGHTVTLYQELIHVPMIIKLPGKNRAKAIDEYVSTVDILPTIVEVAGIGEERDPSLRGHSLLRDLERRAVFSETRRGASLQAVARGGWKLILDTSSRKVSLFQLSDDPGERVDRADDLPEVVESLQLLRKQWAAHESGRWDQGASVEPGLSPAEVERLRGLGYVQ